VVARRWIEQPNAEAFVTFQRFRTSIGDKREHVPKWLEGAPADASADLVKTSRVALEVIATGEREDARAWLSAELARMQQAQAQMLDPVTLTIAGATLIGCILAARVKKIGSAEFYQGIPSELSKVESGQSRNWQVKCRKQHQLIC
jgi:hypothetical protein